MGLELNSRLKVLHVIPALTIGGVEVGIYRSYRELNRSIDYEVMSIKGRGALFLPVIQLSDLIFRIIKRRHLPHVIVSSLWLGHIFGCFFSVLTGARWVPFFHSSRSQGFARDIVLWCSSRIARSLFFDSGATLGYYKTRSNQLSHIIPYRFLPSPSPYTGLNRAYDFIFVGRFSKEKRIDLLLMFLNQLQSCDTNIRVLLVLSIKDEQLSDFSGQLSGIAINVTIMINVEPLEVVHLMLDSYLYLSFSDYEGFSMATVDAMSCGCVPVARPVGEIPKYVSDSCGVLLTDVSAVGLKDAAVRCLNLLRDENLLRKYSNLASQSVAHYDLYTDAFIKGIRSSLSFS